jgi:hypothetical protein
LDVRGDRTVSHMLEKLWYSVVCGLPFRLQRISLFSIYEKYVKVGFRYFLRHPSIIRHGEYRPRLTGHPVVTYFRSNASGVICTFVV